MPWGWAAGLRATIEGETLPVAKVNAMLSAPRPASDAPLVVVTGGDTLVQSVCRDLLEAGRRVVVVGDPLSPLRGRIERDGAAFVAGSPWRKHVLRDAGVASALALLALDADDRVNLEVALQARELNPGIRIVMRQFNRALAGKIEQNLPNCSVMSLAANSAATYAAAAVEQSTFLGIEFPSGSRSLVSFARRTAHDCGVAGMRADEAERHLGCRIVWRGRECQPGDRLGAEEELVVLGPLERFAQSLPHRRRGPLSWIADRIGAIVSEFDPLLRILLVAGTALFLAATIFFTLALRLNPVTAAYFVTATMTTVGYGDVPLANKSHLLQIVDIGLMIAGVIISNLAIAFVAAALVRAQWNALQGLRPVLDRGHIVVFGAGQVGTRVIDYLCELRANVTVVEPKPTPELLRRARSRSINLLTGDGTVDDTLDMCNVAAARSAVVVTHDDATNLEIGFGARARRSEIPVIMRIAEPSFAAAIRNHFEIRRAFSATALAASAFSDLVDSHNARGRLTFGGRSYRIAEFASAASADRSAVPIAAAGAGGAVRAVRDWNDVNPDDAVLVIG